MDSTERTDFSRRAALAERFGEDLVPLEQERTEVDGGEPGQDQLVALATDWQKLLTDCKDDPERLAFVDQLAELTRWFLAHREWPIPATLYTTSRIDADQVAELVAAGHHPMPLLSGTQAAVGIGAAPGPCTVALYAMPFKDDEL